MIKKKVVHSLIYFGIVFIIGNDNNTKRIYQYRINN